MKKIKVRGESNLSIDRQQKTGLFLVAFFIIVIIACYLVSMAKADNEPLQTIKPQKMAKSVQIQAVKKPVDSKIIATGLGSHYSFESCVSSFCKTASGEKLKNEDSVAVPPHWISQGIVKFGDVVKITNLDNGKSVNVKVNDTGSFFASKYSKSGQRRIADLNTYAFKKIASAGSGVIKIKVEKL